MSAESHLTEPQLNATPLIDVLLVLLVMLIFTLPIATHMVKLNLPQRPGRSLPAPIDVEIVYGGDIYWNGQRLSSFAELMPRLAEVAAISNAPLLRVMAERRARYGLVAQVLAAAQRAHVAKLSVTPVPDNPAGS